jgi:hypothetical protein
MVGVIEDLDRVGREIGFWFLTLTHTSGVTIFIYISG